MKFFIGLFLSIAFTIAAFAQVKTTETRTTTDSTGNTVTTNSVIISKSEDITPRVGMINVNPLKFFLFYNLTFYTRLSDRTALGIGAQTPTLKGINGFGLNAEFRIYPSGRSLRGFYFAPNVSYNVLESDDSDDKVTPFSMGVLLGWQWFPGDDFSIGLGLGIDYYSIDTKDDDFNTIDGTVPAVRFDIGYAW